MTGHDCPVTIDVENVGGIEECTVTVDPGVTVLVGRNATNRTSLLTAVAGALGGSDATLKSDADAGRVELRIEEATYRRTFERSNGRVRTGGHPYADDETLVDACVSLLESNPARRAVERGDDLRDVLMAPLDVDSIRRRIRDKEREREEVRRRLDRIEDQRERLPELQERRRELSDRLGDLTEEIAGEEAAIDDYELSVSELSRAEGRLSDLESKRAEKRDLRDRIATQEKSLDALRRERRDVELSLSDVEADPERLERIESEMSRLRHRERRLNDVISDLAAIVEFNEDVLSAETSRLDAVSGNVDVTATLDPQGKRVECWTCGSEVPRREIETRLEDLREGVESRREERQEVTERLAELRERKQSLRDSRERRAELRTRREEIDREIDRRESTVADLRSTVERLADEIEDLESDLGASDALGNSDLLERHRRVTELEYERGRVETELADVESEISEIDGLLDQRDHLEARRSAISDEITELRTLIDDRERSAVESFNEHVDDLLSALSYDDLERVWIERVGEEETRFELHVVRADEEGAVYEDAVDTLSESERTVIGLVVALVGYLVHDVAERVPFLLLDSLEAIDAERIEVVLEYFAEHATYLLVALLPEDAEPITGEHARLSSDEIGR